MKKMIGYMAVAILIIHAWITVSIAAYNAPDAMEQWKEMTMTCAPIYAKILGVMLVIWGLQEWGPKVKRLWRKA